MKTKLNWLEFVLLGAPFIALAIYWNDLPARVPTHWNFRGQIDGWSAKTPGLFLLPFTALAMTVLLHILPWFDPKLRHTPGEESLMPAVLPIVRIAMLTLLDAIFFVQVTTSLGRNVPGSRIMTTWLLLFFVVMGNYLWQFAPQLFCRYPHAVDTGKS